MDHSGGSAVVIRTGSSLTCQDCAFASNSAAEGAAVYIDGAGSAGYFRSPVFTDNGASALGGGAVYLRAQCVAEFEGAHFESNFAGVRDVREGGNPAECFDIGGNAGGGAVYIDADSIAQFRGSDFISNKANWGGGAVYVDGASIAGFDRCFFNGNLARYRGGAVYINGGSTASFVNVAFTGNMAAGWKGGGSGGAVYIDHSGANGEWAGSGWAYASGDGSHVKFQSCQFLDNLAYYGGHGGAVYLGGPSNVMFDDWGLFGNHARAGDYDHYCRVKTCEGAPSDRARNVGTNRIRCTVLPS